MCHAFFCYAESIDVAYILCCAESRCQCIRSDAAALHGSQSLSTGGTHRSTEQGSGQQDAPGSLQSRLYTHSGRHCFCFRIQPASASSHTDLFLGFLFSWSDFCQLLDCLFFLRYDCTFIPVSAISFSISDILVYVLD